MSNTKLNELNELVKNSSNVKIIVLADGTVQAVDIDATNVDDDHPDAEPYAEVKGTKVKVGVQQREPAVDEVVKPVTKRARTPKKDKVVDAVVVKQKDEPVVTKQEKEDVPVVVKQEDELVKKETTKDSVTDVTDK